MSILDRRPLLVCAGLAVLLGCKARDAAPPAPPDEAVLRVGATDFAFDLPNQVQAGITTVRVVNQGQSLHHVQLVKLNDGKTLADFADAMKGGGPLPPWAQLIGGPNAAAPGDSTTAILGLDPGSYAVICLIPASNGVPHVAMGMAHPLTVNGPASAAVEPVADDTVSLVDYGFQFGRPLTAGHHVIRVENTGQQPHELVLALLDAGKTTGDLVSWVDKMTGPPPARPMGGMTGILPGGHGYIVVDVVPGTYAVVCFVPDMKDGKPHVAHGMASTITVS
jgi:uncharacterized cupredoxin-like copper-binding protein